MANNLDSYLALITSEHRIQPDYMAMLAALLGPMVDTQTAIMGLPAAFDIDQAIGAQLDAVGVRVGHDRYVPEPLPDVWFSWDLPGLGWDQAPWRGPYDPTQQLVALDDDTYRLMLRARIATNNWDGTVSGAEAILSRILLVPAALDDFTLLTQLGTPIQTEAGTNLLSEIQAVGAPLLFLQDGFDMTATIALAGGYPGALVIALILAGFIDLRATGVRMDYLITSVNGTPLFGWDVENEYISGFDVGAWGVDTIPDYT